MKEHRPSSEVQAELDASEKRGTDVVTKLAYHEGCIKRLTEELERLNGSRWSGGRGGKIHDLRKELKYARLYEDDLKAIKVVFDNATYGYLDASKPVIVSRVTPKRIFTRRMGDEYETQFHRNGKCVTGGANINLKATFGDDYNETDYRLPNHCDHG